MGLGVLAEAWRYTGSCGFQGLGCVGGCGL